MLVSTLMPAGAVEEEEGVMPASISFRAGDCRCAALLAASGAGSIDPRSAPPLPLPPLARSTFWSTTALLPMFPDEDWSMKSLSTTSSRSDAEPSRPPSPGRRRCPDWFDHDRKLGLLFDLAVGFLRGKLIRDRRAGRLAHVIPVAISTYDQMPAWTASTADRFALVGGLELAAVTAVLTHGICSVDESDIVESYASRCAGTEKRLPVSNHCFTHDKSKAGMFPTHRRPTAKTADRATFCWVAIRSRQTIGIGMVKTHTSVARLTMALTKNTT